MWWHTEPVDHYNDGLIIILGPLRAGRCPGTAPLRAIRGMPKLTTSSSGPIFENY